MTNTHAQAADAILALINGKPWTPTRDEIVSALAKLPPAATPLPPLPMRPTDLGWELIEKLMPAYVEAVRYSSSTDENDPDAAAFEAWTDRTCEAYWGRMREATNLVDMAIAARMAVDGDTPDALLETAQKQWERYDRHEGYSRPESAEEFVGTGTLVTYGLVSAILSMAGIDEARCSEVAVVKANGWDIEPTQQERAEALARLRGGHTNNGRLLRALLA